MNHKSLIVLLLCTLTATAISLDTVLARADSCVAIRWTPDSANTAPFWYRQYGSECTGRDSVYRHSDFIPGIEYQGVAYSYGGEDPHDLFRSRLAAGWLVGSHLCHYRSYGDPSDRVAGTDCSGFLSWVWGTSRHSTRMFLNSSRFNHIALAELLPGDALVKANAPCGYHAVLVMEVNVLQEAVIAEASSSVKGCRMRTTDLTHSYWSCYTPLRNPQVDRTETRVSGPQYRQTNRMDARMRHSPRSRATYFDLRGRNITPGGRKQGTAVAGQQPVVRAVVERSATSHRLVIVTE